NAVLKLLGLSDADIEAVLQHIAIARPHGKLDDMIAVAQAAWRAVEGEAAAQRIDPVREGRTDIVAGKAAVRFTDPLMVDEYIDAGNAGARQCPPFNGQPPGDRFDGSASNNGGGINLQPELSRCGQRWRSPPHDQGGADVLALVVEPIAHNDPQPVAARGDRSER